MVWQWHGVGLACELDGVSCGNAVAQNVVYKHGNGNQMKESNN